MLGEARAQQLTRQPGQECEHYVAQMIDAEAQAGAHAADPQAHPAQAAVAVHPAEQA